MKIEPLTYKQRFECDYHNCNRVLIKNRSTPFECTSCGHGDMIPVRPNAVCTRCFCLIYDNVRDDSETHDIYCGLCTQILVEIATGGSYSPPKRRKRRTEGRGTGRKNVTRRK
jgi:hypothetical protein